MRKKMEPADYKRSADISVGAIVGAVTIWLGVPVRVAFAASVLMLVWNLVMHAILLVNDPTPPDDAHD